MSRTDDIAIRREPTALIVEPDPAERERLAVALDALGFEAILCPGPGADADACIGIRTARCPLSADADVVIMSTRLPVGERGVGTTGDQLLEVYLAQGKRVVVAAADDDDVHRRIDARVVTIRRGGDPLDLVNAVRALRASG